VDTGRRGLLLVVAWAGGAWVLDPWFLGIWSGTCLWLEG
jgi:hypothetical protein